MTIYIRNYDTYINHLQILLAIFTRGYTGDFFKGFAEMGKVVEADGGGNIGYAPIGIAKQALCLLRTRKNDVIGESEASHLLEHPAQIVGADKKMVRQSAKSKRLCKVSVYIADNF